MGGTPKQTVFCLFPEYNSLRPSFIFQRGAHKPSPAESLAPFHQDPAQRIIVLNMQPRPIYLVVRVEALLELLKDREGTEVGWDEWKNHVAIPSFSPGASASLTIQVSGCRLFYVYSTASSLCSQMEVYDFSMQGRAKYLSKRKIRGLRTLNHLSSTRAKRKIPSEDLFDLFIGHESIIFFHVSATAVCAFLNETKRVPCISLFRCLLEIIPSLEI